MLRPGRVFLQLIERRFVVQRRGVVAHGTFVDHVVDLAEHGIGGDLPLGQPMERLDLADQLGPPGGQSRRLLGQIVHLPVQQIAQQPGRFIVQIMAGRDHAEAELPPDPVEGVALERPAGRAGAAPRRIGDLRHAAAIFFAQIIDDQRQPFRIGEGAAFGFGDCRVAADALLHMQPGRRVAHPIQEIPQPQTILAAGNRHQDRFIPAEHPVVVDRPPNLVHHIMIKAAGAKGRVMAGQLDNDRRRMATPTPHDTPRPPWSHGRSRRTLLMTLPK